MHGDNLAFDFGSYSSHNIYHTYMMFGVAFYQTLFYRVGLVQDERCDF